MALPEAERMNLVCRTSAMFLCMKVGLAVSLVEPRPPQFPCQPRASSQAWQRLQRRTSKAHQTGSSMLTLLLTLLDPVPDMALMS